MLSIFRKGATKKILLGFLGLALFAMVITGFGGDGTGGLGALGGARGDRAATVGGEPVSVDQLNAAVRRQFESARQQQPSLDMRGFFAAGAFETLLDQLITGKAFQAFGEKIGIVASKRMVDGEIASIPAFQNLAGQFDENAFRTMLARENLTEAEVRSDVASALVSRNLLLPLGAAGFVPDAMGRHYTTLLMERRSGGIGLIPAEAFLDRTPPSDADLATFYRTNGARYTRPEQRVLRYALFNADNIPAPTATNAEIAAAYKAAGAKYAAQSSRTLGQAIYPSEAAARAAAAKAAQGGLKSAAGSNFIDLGAQTQSAFAQISSAEVAKAAFQAQQGAVTAPVRSPLGWHVVEVIRIDAGAGTTLEQARAELSKEITDRKRQEAMADFVARLEDKLADGESIENVARSEKLTLAETPLVTVGGQTLAGAAVAAEVQPLVKAGFDMDADQEPVVETLPENKGYALLAVGRVVTAAPPPLGEIKAQVVRDLSYQRAAARARQAASAIAANVNGGKTLKQAFAEAGRPLPAVRDTVARRADVLQAGEQAPPPLRLMFEMAKGKARIMPSPNGGGWFVVHVAASQPGAANAAPPAMVAGLSRQFAADLGSEYGEQFARAVQGDVKIKRNEDAIRTARQNLLRGTAATEGQ